MFTARHGLIPYIKQITFSLKRLSKFFLNPLNAELNPICYLLALLGALHFLHVSGIRVNSLTLRLLMSYIYIYIYGAPTLDVSRTHKASHHPGLSAPLQPRFGSLRLLAFTKAKIAVEREEICKCNGYTVHKLSQWRLTAD